MTAGADAEAIDQFNRALKRRGLVPPTQLIADGRIQRCDTSASNGRGDGAYILHLDGLPAGGFQNWQDGLGWEDWRVDLGRKFTLEELAAQRKHLEADRGERELEDARREVEAAARAQTIWHDTKPSSADHPYLKRKFVKSYGLRQSRGNLVIPMRDVAGVLHSLQFIDETGTKKFLKGTKITAHFFMIGEPTDVILIGEGYATCASSHEATGHAAVVAFDCANMKPVAEAIGAKYPAARIVLLADDDHHKPGNPGLNKARAAAEAVAGIMAIPDFGADRQDDATDFNDLAQHSGPNVVRRCIEDVVAKADAQAYRKTQDTQTGRPIGANSEDQVNATISRLAGLPDLAYCRQRKDEADALGLGVTWLDKLVIQAKKTANPAATNADAGAGQGRPIRLPEPEPWPEEVDGAALLSNITLAVSRYMVVEPGAAECVALWAVHTHALDAFGITPRLAITSPRPQCGKTTLLDILQRLVARPLLAANVTAAAVFRVVEVALPTLLVDEADTFLPKNDELRGVLNSGHRRGGSVIRVVGEGMEVREFSTWGAAAIAMIGDLPSTLLDRSISIMLKRKRPDEVVESFRYHRTQDIDSLGRMCARWAADNITLLRSIDPIVPSNLYNRAADNWQPLLAIADVAGGTWPERARSIAAATVDADQVKRIGLLADVRDVFDAKGVDRIRSIDLVAALVTMEGHPWAEYGKSGKPLSANGLARMLANDKISPNTIRFGTGPDDTGKGYERKQFEDAFARYLVSLPNTIVTPSHPPDFAEVPLHLQPSHLGKCDGSQITRNGSISEGCDGVTVQEPVFGDEEATWTA